MTMLNRWSLARTGRAAALLVLVAPALIATATASADSLVLKSAVRARSNDGVILLRDVADLQGNEIARYADVVVATVPAGSPAKELSVDEIRRRLDQAGVNWAKIDLDGRRVIIRPRQRDAAGPPGACVPASVEPGARSLDGGVDARSGDGSTAGRAESQNGAERATPTRFDPVRGPRRNLSEPVSASAVAAENSVRALVCAALVQALNEPADAVRVSFDGLDASTLAEVPPGVRIEIEPIGMLDADRAEFAVRWWRDGRVERRTSLSAFAEVARTAAVPKRNMRKGDSPSDADVEGTLCWVRPSERDRIVGVGALGGRAFATSVRSGEPLLDSQFERQLLIKRGERIVVRTVVGSLAVSVDAIAQSDGREGEMIQCVRVGAPGRRDKSSFSAVVTSRGEAVVSQPARTG